MGAKTAGKIFCKKFFFKKIDCGPKPFKTAFNPPDCGTIAKKNPLHENLPAENGNLQ